MRRRQFFKPLPPSLTGSVPPSRGPAPAESDLFVYGTLRKGQKNPFAARLAGQGRWISEGTLQGRLYELGGYPGVVDSADPQDRVLGDVFRIPAFGNLLRWLDAYEGCSPRHPRPHEYRRQRVPVTLSDGTVRHCWCYLYNGATEGLKPILSGDYLSGR
ncbi:gamma-glutamylcyclotransferase [Magnetospira thiophila]